MLQVCITSGEERFATCREENRPVINRARSLLRLSKTHFKKGTNKSLVGNNLWLNHVNTTVKGATTKLCVCDGRRGVAVVGGVGGVLVLPSKTIVGQKYLRLILEKDFERRK